MDLLVRLDIAARNDDDLRGGSVFNRGPEHLASIAIRKFHIQKNYLEFSVFYLMDSSHDIIRQTDAVSILHKNRQSIS